MFLAGSDRDGFFLKRISWYEYQQAFGAQLSNQMLHVGS
jgi:hypothetical protein